MASCGISNIQLYKSISLTEIRFMYMGIVHLKHIQFISTITYILPVSFMYVCITLRLLVCNCVIQMYGNSMQFKDIYLCIFLSVHFKQRTNTAYHLIVYMKFHFKNGSLTTNTALSK